MQFRRQRHTLWRSFLRSALGVALGSLCLQALGDVTITQPTGGNNIPADKAVNSTNGAGYTSLGSIVITEGSTIDFATGAGKTIVFSMPSGWQLNAGVGSVSFQGSRDITAASISVTTSNFTITLTVGGGTKFDTLTISALQ